MAEVTTYRFTGDKYKGQGLWKLGLNQLDILKRQMELGNLKIFERTVSYADGTKIHCKTVHGISTIEIHCPFGVGQREPVEVVEDPDIFIAYSTADREKPKAYDIVPPAPYLVEDWKKDVPYMWGTPENFDGSKGIISLLKSYTFNTALAGGKGSHSTAIFHKKAVSVPDVFGIYQAITQLERIQVYHDCVDEGIWVDIQGYAVNFWVYPDGSFAVVSLDIVYRTDTKTYWRYRATVRKYTVKGEPQSTVSYDSNEAELTWNYRSPRWGTTVAYDGNLDRIYTNAWAGGNTTVPAGNIKWTDEHVVQDETKLFDYDPVSREVKSLVTQRRKRSVAHWSEGFGDYNMTELWYDSYPCQEADPPDHPDAWHYRGYELLHGGMTPPTIAYAGDGIEITTTDGQIHRSGTKIRVGLEYQVCCLNPTGGPGIVWYATFNDTTGIPNLTPGQCWHWYEGVEFLALITSLIAFYDFVTGEWEFYDFVAEAGYGNPYQLPWSSDMSGMASDMRRNCTIYNRSGLVTKLHSIYKTFKFFTSIPPPGDPDRAEWEEAHFAEITVLGDPWDYDSTQWSSGPPPKIWKYEAAYGADQEPYEKGVVLGIPDFSVETSLGAYRMLHTDPNHPLMNRVRMFKQLYTDIPVSGEQVKQIQAWRKNSINGLVQTYRIPIEPRRWTANGALLKAHHYQVRRID
ncbi:MAG: hypothetical protein HGA63_00705 [Syntrophobacteraceae bacterium]|nr:hypothetical protein [Syntrophobacteraceae bacterium]